MPPFSFIWNAFLPTLERKIRVVPLFGICEFIWAHCFSLTTLKICLWKKDLCGFVTEMEKCMCQYNYINYLWKFRDCLKTLGLWLNSVQDSTMPNHLEFGCFLGTFSPFHCYELIWTSTGRVYGGDKCPCVYILGISGILWRQLYLGQLNTEIMLLLNVSCIYHRALGNHYPLALYKMYSHWQCLIKLLKTEKAEYRRGV